MGSISRVFAARAFAQGTNKAGASQAQDLPAALPVFAKGIKQFSAEELNAALRTVFGEISSNPHPQLASEAKAISSTIFNRLGDIAKSRAQHAQAFQVFKGTQARFNQAQTHLEELGRNPSKYKRELTPKGYDDALAKARAEYNAAQKAHQNSDKGLRAASDYKIASESYLKPAERSQSHITLDMIVNVQGQYEGTPKGLRDFNAYPKMSDTDKKRHVERWNAAKAAIKLLAEDPTQADKYRQFRSNFGGKRKLSAGEVRIGGNDFW